jgi:hypothetical protein
MQQRSMYTISAEFTDADIRHQLQLESPASSSTKPNADMMASSSHGLQYDILQWLITTPSSKTYVRYCSGCESKLASVNQCVRARRFITCDEE